MTTDKTLTGPPFDEPYAWRNFRLTRRLECEEVSAEEIAAALEWWCRALPAAKEQHPEWFVWPTK
jgi:hypothetical protein